ncbi:MAG: hypothetical protein VB050_11705 [Geobacteraceae bacterium]|nr:hypothetical protein [Geobacteraceae bacterium]
MAIDSIAGSEKITAVPDAAGKIYQQAAREQEVKKGTDPARDSDVISLQMANSSMGRLGSVNEELNLVAKGIRETDRALREASGIMDRMKDRLDVIIKNNPPFPSESAERKEILMSYTSLRKEILKLTFPPPPPPIYEKNTALWEKLGFADKEKMAGSVPDVSEVATDTQVRSAAMGIEELRSAVMQGRNELAMTVKG